jgi:nucleotide-binding universal stress UspA family protein
MKILLAVDGSSCSLRAVRYVIRHLLLFGKRPGVTLLHLDPPAVEQVAVVMTPEEIADYHEKNGKAALRAAGLALSKAGISHRKRLLVGEPGGAIARTAKESRCNMIVMGSHGHGALKGLLLGSVVTKVLAQTDIPVLIVR